MIAGFLPLLVMGLLVYGVVRLLTGRRDPDTGESLEGETREFVIRVFRLLLLAGAAILAVEGVSALIAVALPRSGELSRNSLEIAQALSFTIVGVPAVVGLALWTRKRLEADPDEAISVVWALFLGGMLILAQIILLVSIYDLLDWLVGDDSFNQRALGRMITWGALFGAFWVLNERRPLVDVRRRPERRTPMYVVVGSGIALAIGSWGVWELVRAAIRPVYDSVLGGDLLATDRGPGALAVAHALVGAAVWGWFWVGRGLRSPRCGRWYAYVLLVGVLGGLVVAVSAGGVTIHSLLQWWFGNPSAGTAAVHFDVLPGSLAALAVGLAVWVHHRLESAETGAGRREVDRVYEYLVAFSGLVVCSIAATLAVTAFIEAVADTAIVSEGISNSVVLAITFIVLGLPLWWWFWRRAERQVAANPGELLSISRRVYVIVTLGVSATVALISLVIMLTIFFEDMAGGDLSGETLRRLRVPLGLVIASLVVAVYHGLVYRDDRDGAPSPPPPAPVRHHVQRLVVVSDLSREATEKLVSQLTGSAATRSVQYRTVGDGVQPDEAVVESALDELGGLPGAEALVMIADGAITVRALVG